MKEQSETSPKEELEKEIQEETISEEEHPPEETLLQEKELEEKNLRLLAEMENLRKRLMKEKQEAVRFAIEKTVLDFLPIIDGFEQALKFSNQSSDEVKQWASGFQMFLTQLKDTIHNHGVVAFHSEGNQFDPYYHEAVEMVETDEYPENTVLEELSKGYKSNQRTIRPAKVKVAKAISSKKDEETDEKKGEE